MTKKLGQTIAQEVKDGPICDYMKLGSSSKSQKEYNGKIYANGSPHQGTS